MDARLELPPVVYVPCGGQPSDKDGRVVIEFRERPDGSIVLPVYTALDRLVRCCGEGQPWALLTVAELAEIDEQSPYDAVVIDAELPPADRKSGR